MKYQGVNSKCKGGTLWIFFQKLNFFLPHFGFIYLVLHAELYYRFVLFHSGMDFYNIFSKLIFKIL